MNPGSSPRYRFGPRDRRGIVAGLRAGQIVIFAVSALLGVLAIRTVGRLGVAVAVAIVGIGTVAAFLPLQGRAADEWLPVAARFVVDRAFGRSSARIVHDAAGRTHAPRPFSSLEVVALDGAEIDGAFGALRDRRSGTWTAVLSLATEQFALLSEPERARRVAAWSGVLAAVSSHASGIHRLQWIERTLPDDGGLLRTHLETHGVGGRCATDAERTAVASYEALVAAEGAGLRHELFLACTVAGRAHADASLATEVALLDERCRAAAIPVEGVLSPVGLSTLIRRSFDGRPTAAPTSWAWPVAVESSWSRIRTDATWHACYWIAEWPRTDVSSDFLLPLLVGCGERRTIAVVMSSVPPARALRAAEHARTSTSADVELRRRHGVATSARRAREFEAVTRREGELADGHIAYRFSGYITVTVDEPDALDSACARVEQAAALSRLELRRLYGAQADALVCALPAGRGCA